MWDRHKNPSQYCGARNFRFALRLMIHLQERLTSGYDVHCNLSLGGSIREFLDTCKKVFMGIVAILFLLHSMLRLNPESRVIGEVPQAPPIHMAGHSQCRTIRIERAHARSGNPLSPFIVRKKSATPSLFHEGGSPPPMPGLVRRGMPDFCHF